MHELRLYVTLRSGPVRPAFRVGSRGNACSLTCKLWARMTAVAVLSGRERRRWWTPAEELGDCRGAWREANVTEVARRHDVHPNLLDLWRKQARIGVLGGELASGTAAGSAVFFTGV